MDKVNVYSVNGKDVVEEIQKPTLFDMELRNDLVQKVYGLVRQNSRQPYAVSPYAGMQHSAQSWGTGRAMARVPRVKGGGTRRAGQAAFANFARKGRMAHPTTTHRRWHKKTNKFLRRLVTCMGVAATANPAIVEGRGHRVTKIKSFPIVVQDEVTEFTKTKQAATFLKEMGLDEDLQKVKDSKTLTTGKGKWRGRRHTQRLGVLLIHHSDDELKAFSNLQGLEMLNINCLNLLKLCPGGQMGRLTVFTRSAFMKLESLFSEERKQGFYIPDNVITSDNLDEYFYSPEIQSLITIPNLLPKGTIKKSKEEIEKMESMIDLFVK